MLDREKAIKALEKCCTPGINCTECPLFSEVDCTNKLLCNYLSLLKAQEPVQVVRLRTINMLFWCCGSCGALITDADKFCRMCGKELKWEYD